MFATAFGVAASAANHANVEAEPLTITHYIANPKERWLPFRICHLNKHIVIIADYGLLAGVTLENDKVAVTDVFVPCTSPSTITATYVVDLTVFSDPAIHEF